ncbi:hypothetical protein Ddye_022146, partial [Dipteronia dyeriana]
MFYGGVFGIGEIWLSINKYCEKKVDQAVEKVVSHRWQAPPVGCFKINTDAALNVNGKGSGFGVVDQDCYGQVMVSFCRNVTACYEPKITEALVILEVIRLVVNRRLLPAILESDAFVVVQAI